ncbi:membrane or secreted protein [Persephonella marina EX-H1]|uniref:Membrane or secreted protein n=2 Tax=Hydrogenothermaceae TaxID=224027 RepID=C0QT31_PERMH|nr:membrane or secreted protein [Persephonella marina EX-H1]
MQIMMMDPEIKKIMMKHMRECKKQVMKKMMGDQMVLKRMIRMLVMNKDTEKEILKENPDLKEEIKSMLK